MSPLTRSQLLRRTGLVAAGSLLPRFALADGVAEAAGSPVHPSLIALSTNIPNLETPAQYLRTTITPNDVFYVRTHWASDLGRKAGGWSMRVEGLVGRPLEVDLAALQALPKYEVVHVLQCSGNGRELSRPHVTGSQWRIGAVGNAVWGGARVADIVAKAGGLGHGVRYLTGIGGETPPDPEIMKPVTRAIPVEKAMSEGLVVYEMNGELLAPFHGKPFRLLIPGYYGVNNIKWLKTLRADRTIPDSPFMKDSYRVFLPGQPKERAKLTYAQEVKSMLTSAVAASFAGSVQAGKTLLQGIAWSGDGPVTAVEVSIDGGRSWRPAAFTGPSSRYGWRTFLYETTLRRGHHTILSRAHDQGGAVQPLRNVFNLKGYSDHSISSHAVQLEAI